MGMREDVTIGVDDGDDVPVIRVHQVLNGLVRLIVTQQLLTKCSNLGSELMS